MKDYVILIPALNPPSQLISYVSRLKKDGFKNILLVNDGSRAEYNELFSKISDIEGCRVITHKENMGKGRALKDAFLYFLEEKKSGDFEDIKGIITVDSDGQHTVEDVEKIAAYMDENGDCLVLGTRDFDAENVPPKSKIGNKFTKSAFRLFTGCEISDTQTGLRGIPVSMLDEFTKIKGERFEYETAVLMDCIKRGIKIREVPIQTVYVDGNSETHFRPVVDSVKIIRVVVGTFTKYIMSSLCSFLVDYGLFCLILLVTGTLFDKSLGIWISTIIARICSSLFNYTVNKRVVFASDKGSKTIIYYYILAAVQMALSAFFVWCLSLSGLIDARLAKLIVDTILFLVSYQVQKRIIF